MNFVHIFLFGLFLTIQIRFVVGENLLVLAQGFKGDPLHQQLLFGSNFLHLLEHDASF